MGHRQLQGLATECSPDRQSAAIGGSPDDLQPPDEPQGSAATEFSPERKLTESGGSPADLNPEQLRGRTSCERFENGRAGRRLVYSVRPGRHRPYGRAR